MKKYTSYLKTAKLSLMILGAFAAGFAIARDTDPEASGSIATNTLIDAACTDTDIEQPAAEEEEVYFTSCGGFF